MQITIVQNEIEKAIREYVGRQLLVAEGMKMIIDLAATRGAEGFKATIDIIPEGQLVTDSVSNLAPNPSSIKPSFPSFSNALTKAAEETVKLNEPIEAVTAEALLSDSEEASTSGDKGENEATPNVESSSTSNLAVATPAGSNTRSIFKGLNKPKNN